MKHFKILSIVFVLIAISFTSCSTSSPGDVIKKSYDLIKAEKYEAVTKLYVKKGGEKLSKDEAKKVEGLFGMAASEMDKKEGYKSITINNEEISEDGDSAHVEYTIEYKNGDKEEQDSKLLKVDGKWFILFSMN